MYNMDDIPYQNREIREMFNDVKIMLNRIEIQTVKTNGRVGKLERWQSYVLGFCGAVTIFLLPDILNLF